MLAIIGGTGLYDLPGMVLDDKIIASTPFGDPSGAIVRGRVGEQPVLFLSRHGVGHRLLPHEINYRANIYALKQAGATQILGFSAVGSLVEEIAPGDLAMPEQYFDWTRGERQRTFFGNGVTAHVSTARPVSSHLVDWVAARAKVDGIGLHRNLTYACVDGPRLGTRAESLFLRWAGCHLVGMTNVPEVFLAREAQICYATIGIVTDYDCWMEDQSRHASVQSIMALFGRSMSKAMVLLAALLRDPAPQEEPEVRQSLCDALLTSPDTLAAPQREWLSVLRK